MLELFEKAVLTGIGAIAITQKKGEEMMADLKDKYKVSEEEGKAFIDKLQGMAKETREKLAEAADHEVKRAMERIGVVPKEDFDRLQARLEELEKRLGAQE